VAEERCAPVAVAHEMLQERRIEPGHRPPVDLRWDCAGFQLRRELPLDVDTAPVGRLRLIRQRPAELVHHRLVRRVALHRAADVDEHQIARAQLALAAAEHRRGGADAHAAARTVETCRMQRVLPEAELPDGHVDAEHAEAHRALVALAHHQRVQVAGEFRLVHALAHQPRHLLLQQPAVNRTAAFHQRQLVRALDHAYPRGCGVERGHVAAQEVFPETLHERERRELGFEMDRPPARRAGRKRVAVALHRADVGEERLGAGALVAAPYPQHRLAAARHQQESVLHRAGEVVLVDPAEQRR